MDDLDLADALESSLDLNDAADVQTLPLGEGLEMLITRNSVQRVATLVMAARRLKQAMAGRRLCRDFFNSVVEETPVKTAAAACCGKARTFTRTGSESVCELLDRGQRSVHVEPDTMKLQAVVLQAGDTQCTVEFKMASYVTFPIVRTVLLSLCDYKLSCVMDGDRADLKLEKRPDVLESITQDDERFLFSKHTEGDDYVMFESVKCPGWFISTTSQVEQQVQMCRRGGQHLIRFRRLSPEKSPKSQ